MKPNRLHNYRQLQTVVRTLLGCFFVLLSWSSYISAPQSPAEVREAQVKAGFLFNFPNFVDWRQNSLNAAREFKLCLLESSLEQALNSLVQNQTINGKAIRVERRSTSQGFDDCQVLFFGSSEAARSPAVFRSLETKPILTVGEDPDFLQNGGMIRLKKVENRIGFDINVGAARRAGLQISSRLLRLAETVQGREQP